MIWNFSLLLLLSVEVLDVDACSGCWFSFDFCSRGNSPSSASSPPTFGDAVAAGDPTPSSRIDFTNGESSNFCSSCESALFSYSFCIVSRNCCMFSAVLSSSSSSLFPSSSLATSLPTSSLLIPLFCWSLSFFAFQLVLSVPLFSGGGGFVAAFAGNLNTTRFPQLEIKNASSKMDRSTSREARRAYMRSSVLLFRSSTSSAASFSVDSIIVTKERDGCVFCVRN